MRNPSSTNTCDPASHATVPLSIPSVSLDITLCSKTTTRHLLVKQTTRTVRCESPAFKNEIHKSTMCLVRHGVYKCSVRKYVTASSFIPTIISSILLHVHSRINWDPPAAVCPARSPVLAHPRWFTPYHCPWFCFPKPYGCEPRPHAVYPSPNSREGPPQRWFLSFSIVIVVVNTSSWPLSPLQG